MKFRCFCGKAFGTKRELQTHIFGFTRGLISYSAAEHAEVMVDLDVRKIFQAMPIVPDTKFICEKRRINQPPPKTKSSRKYGKSKCIRCGDNPALADNGGLCEECGKGFSNPQFNGGYACNG